MKPTVISLILALYAYGSFGQKPKPRTTETIVVKTKQDEYRTGDDVRISFNVINDTDNAVEISREQFYFPNCSILRIIGPNGPVDCTVVEKEREPLPLKKLTAGAYAEYGFSLSSCFDLEQPGQYTLEFNYEQSDGQKVNARPFTFSILEKEKRPSRTID
jgi:hypothetical protein